MEPVIYFNPGNIYNIYVLKTSHIILLNKVTTFSGKFQFFIIYYFQLSLENFLTLVDDISIENQPIKRFVKFYNKVICSENPVVQFSCSLVNQFSNSTVCRSLNYVRNKFSITIDKKLEIPHDKIVNLMKENDSTNDDDVFNICCIKDVINLRENNNASVKLK